MEALGQRLREIRIDAGLTGRDLAKLAGWHSSKVSKIEYARQVPTTDNIRDWCRLCEVAWQAEDLMANLRTIESTFVQWRRLERSGLRHAQVMVLPLWEATTHFRAYTCRIIPGILQTREYTHAVLSAVSRHRGVPGDVEAAVEVRMNKQSVLHQREKRFSIVIEEAVMRHRMVVPEVMAGQLEHLLAVISWPAVSLSIIPASTQRRRSPAEDFWIFDDRRVNVELVSGWLTITAPHEVGMYVQAHQELSGMAVSGEPARDRVTAAIRALS